VAVQVRPSADTVPGMGVPSSAVSVTPLRAPPVDVMRIGLAGATSVAPSAGLIVTVGAAAGVADAAGAGGVADAAGAAGLADATAVQPLSATPATASAATSTHVRFDPDQRMR